MGSCVVLSLGFFSDTCIFLVFHTNRRGQWWTETDWPSASMPVTSSYRVALWAHGLSILPEEPAFHRPDRISSEVVWCWSEQGEHSKPEWSAQTYSALGNWVSTDIFLLILSIEIIEGGAVSLGTKTCCIFSLCHGPLDSALWTDTLHLFFFFNLIFF